MALPEAGCELAALGGKRWPFLWGTPQGGVISPLLCNVYLNRDLTILAKLA